MREVVAVLSAQVVFVILATGFTMHTFEMSWTTNIIDIALMSMFLGLLVTLGAIFLLAIYKKTPEDPAAFALAQAAAGALMFSGVAGIPGGLLIGVFGFISGLVGSLTTKLFWRPVGFH